MRALKSIVRWFFAIQAAIFLLIPLAGILVGLKRHMSTYVAHSASARAHHAGNAAGYAVVAGMVALGLLFAMAWWTTRKTSAGLRGWAIAASVVNVGEGILALLLTHLTRGLMRSSLREGLWFLGLGALGIFLFARREATAAVPVVERKSISGDRTSAFTRHAVTVLTCVAEIAAIVIWYRWAHTRDLFRFHGLAWLALVTVASVATTILHECGHALIAWCFEMSLLSFKAGPFQWLKREGKWTFKLHLAGLLTPGGAVGAVSKDPDQPRWEMILMIAAGPLANLLFAIPAIYAVLHDDWPHYQQSWELVAFTASFCVIAAVFNLFPFMLEEGAYSDGARILQIVTNSPLEEYHRTMVSIASTATTERRYRDLDVAAIQRAAGLFPGTFRGLHLNLCACHCFEDMSRFPEATAALASAEAIYNDSAIDLPAPLHTVFVIGHAYLNRDAAVARVWWDRMEAKQNERQNVDYWLARTALLWIEGDAQAADEAWFKADSMAQALPKFGAYEFDRFRCFLLRQALNEEKPAIEPASAQPVAAPPGPVVSRDQSVVAAPILPAWITPAVVPAVQDAPGAVPPLARNGPPIGEQMAADKAEPYSDSASMFARLTSLTARSAGADSPSDRSPEPPAKSKSETVDVEPEPTGAAEKSERLSRAMPAGSMADPIDAAITATDDPFASVLLPADRNLPELLSAPMERPFAALATWSARPSAPPLAGAPCVTPLPLESWSSLPPAGGPASFAASPVQIPPKGPSVPAAFARRPRVTGPMPLDPLALPTIEERAVMEPELSRGSATEETRIEAMEAQAVSPVQIVQEVVVTAPQIVAAIVNPPAALVPSESISRVSDATPPAAGPDAEEKPRFDPLAFIRAAAMENLTT